MLNTKQATIAPDFTVTDSEGKTIRLSDYRDKKHTVLVLNRGFSCPYTRRHMAQLRQDYPQFVEQDAQVIAIGPEDAETFSYFWRKERMPFTGIPDHKHIVANLYGQKVDPIKLGRMPALVVVDKSGSIRYQHYGNSMSDIPTNREILSLLYEMNNESVANVINNKAQM